jgi:hypothetical protein
MIDTSDGLGRDFCPRKLAPARLISGQTPTRDSYLNQVPLLLVRVVGRRRTCQHGQTVADG